MTTAVAQLSRKASDGGVRGQPLPAATQAMRNPSQPSAAPPASKGMERSVALCYLLIAGITLAANWFPVPVWLHMLPMTVLIIYIGCKATVQSSPGEKIVAERMDTKQVYMFPIMGSAVLFSLYLVFKFLPAEYVNIAVKGYFFVLGSIVLGSRWSSILSKVPTPPAIARVLAIHTSFRPPKWLSWIMGSNSSSNSSSSGGATTPSSGVAASTADDNIIDVYVVDVLGFLIAGVIGTWYLLTNHWIASNIFGIAFSLQGIELIQLGSFFNGAVLLSGLFVYDVFWVFGTDVMVTVAKSFDAPIKLLFPQPGVDAAGLPLRNSMLGLGDIIIPGIFIALMFRFDHYLNSLKPEIARQPDVRRVPTPYFKVQLVFYFLGLLTTLVIMYKFAAAQPALLYLVPACLGAALGTALVRGELRLLLKFQEAGAEDAAKPAAAAADAAGKAVKAE